MTISSNSKIRNGHQYNFWMSPNDLVDGGHVARLGAQAFTLYMVLLRHSSAERRCFPSYSLLQKETGLSRPSVAKAIAKLIDLGYVRKLSIGTAVYNSTLYELLDLSLVLKPQLVSEINQLADLTSQQDEPQLVNVVNSQLVNDVNSKNTNDLTKPIQINPTTALKKKTVVVSQENLLQEENMNRPNYPPNSPEAQMILEEVRKAFEQKQGKMTESVRVLVLVTDPTKVRQAIAVLLEQKSFTKSPEAFFVAAIKNGFQTKFSTRKVSGAIPPDFTLVERSLVQAIASKDYEFALGKLDRLTADGHQSLVDRLLEAHSDWEETLAAYEVLDRKSVV